MGTGRLEQAATTGPSFLALTWPQNPLSLPKGPSTRRGADPGCSLSLPTSARDWHGSTSQDESAVIKWAQTFSIPDVAAALAPTSTAGPVLA